MRTRERKGKNEKGKIDETPTHGSHLPQESRGCNLRTIAGVDGKNYSPQKQEKPLLKKQEPKIGVIAGDALTDLPEARKQMEKGRPSHSHGKAQSYAVSVQQEGGYL